MSICDRWNPPEGYPPGQTLKTNHSSSRYHLARVGSTGRRGSEMRHLEGVRYATPLREGGSLPAIVETDTGELFVVKFRGAGQGHRALVAEALAAALAEELGLPVEIGSASGSERR